MASRRRLMPPNHLTGLDYSVLQQCMHCGLCLPACPTYAETKVERHSPRGRIALMRAIADGELAVTPTFGEEMYYCLGCLACTSACPAGVDYARLFEAARATAEEERVLRSPRRDFWRWLALRTLFTRPRLLRAVGRVLSWYQHSGCDRLARRLKLTSLLPRRLRELEPATPRICRQFSDALIAPSERPAGPARHRVALLTGCVQDLAFSDINRATADVLLANGCEVITPRNQPCCGSLHGHNGDLETARALARRQLDAIDPFTVDAIISNAGGCGSHLRTYGTLLAHDGPYAARAAEWSRKLRDIHEWLVEIGFRAPRPEVASPALPAIPGSPAVGDPLAYSLPRPIQDPAAGRAPATAPTRPGPPAPVSVTYHESCHLCHGQKIAAAPRTILRAIPGLTLTECAESTWCCGSAGIYSITHPDTAGRLQQRKIGHVLATGAGTVATANPGCHLQLANGLMAAGQPRVHVVHPVVLLARAYAAEHYAG